MSETPADTQKPAPGIGVTADQQAPAKASAPWSLKNVPFVVATGVAAVLALALILTLTIGRSDGGSSAPATAESAASTDAGTVRIAVVMTLSDGKTARAGCVGTGGYSDIGPGTPVRITNQAGDILSAGSLGEGVSSIVGNSATCMWTVGMKDIPAGEKFYSAEVGSRGQITKSADDLAASYWKFELSLG
jgi:hypothetical protein